MARIRSIKPDFFTDDEIVELSLVTRLVFIGLWTLADREGRLEHKPRQIKMKLFPADEVDIVETLHELSRAGFIQLYTVDEKDFIEIRNFAKHQRPHPNEAKSVLPSPSESGALVKISSGIVPGSLSSVSGSLGVGASDAAFATVTPPPPLKKPESPKAEPNGFAKHPAVTVYEEIFGPPRLELATSIALTVKDLGVWHDLLTEKSGWSNPEKWIIKAYRERLAESPPSDPDKPPGKILTAREANEQARIEEERINAEFEAERAAKAAAAAETDQRD